MELIKELGIRLNGKRGYMWALFKCPICNAEIERMKHQGKVQETCPSCSRELHAQKVKTHGDRYSRLYRIWINIKVRIYNKNDSKYPLYGGRGITLCKEWHTYLEFKTWALTNGYTDELTIDRIDVNGNYEPANCKFITNKENAGKDKIVISYKQFKDIQTLIYSGSKIADAYKSLGFSRTAYYNAKKRYND